MAGWEFQYNDGAAWDAISGFAENVLGSALLSATRIARGSEGYADCIAGRYAFTVIDDGGVLKAHLDTPDGFNYGNWHRNDDVVIAADGATVNYRVVPGWAIVFSTITAVDDRFAIYSNTVETSVGSKIRAIEWGPSLNGFDRSYRGLRIENTSGGNLTDCVLMTTHTVLAKNAAEATRRSPFTAFWQSGQLIPVPFSASTWKIVTFDNYAAGSPATGDMLIDGDAWDVYDLTNDELIPNGVGLQFDGTTVYRFPQGSDYAGGTFILSEDYVDGDEGELFVSDGGYGCLLKSGGVAYPGLYGIPLTSTGQTAGTVLAGDTIEVSFGLCPPESMTAELNQRNFAMLAVGFDGSDAEYSECIVGTYNLAQELGEPLMFSVTVLQEEYPLQHYALQEKEEPEDPDVFLPDDTGDYVEDEQTPGTYILATSHPTGGNYQSISGMLEDSGVYYE